MTVITVTNSADEGSGSLRQAIYDAQSGDIIRFDSSLSNQKITLSSGLWLNKSLTFDGADAPNLTISGGNKTNIFWMGGVEEKLNLTVKNLTLADSYYDAEAGGAIYAQENSTVSIDNVNFTGNVSDGAALHAQQGSFITVNNSNFDHNDGTSISDKEYSTGAISLFAFGELKVSNSSFTDNKGFNGGAIHVTSSDLFVENSTFIGNDSTPGKDRINYIPGAGGAIYADAASVPNDEKFYGNLPEHVLQGEAVGGVISINNSHFENNKAAGQGGALALWGYSQDQVTVINNTIINNEVIKNKDNMAQGGGIWLMGYGTVENNTISNNRSEDQGGGLFLWGEVPTTVSNTNFSGNQAATGGAIYSDIWDGQVNINDTKFDSNAASVEGGVLFTNKIRPVYIQGSQFSNNTAGDIADTSFDNSISEVSQPEIPVESPAISEPSLSSSLNNISGAISVFNTGNGEVSRLDTEPLAQNLALNVLESDELTGWRSTDEDVSLVEPSSNNDWTEMSSNPEGSITQDISGQIEPVNSYQLSTTAQPENSEAFASYNNEANQLQKLYTEDFVG
jgi:predicted outer membrane repeat protein